MGSRPDVIARGVLMTFHTKRSNSHDAEAYDYNMQLGLWSRLFDHNFAIVCDASLIREKIKFRQPLSFMSQQMLNE